MLCCIFFWKALPSKSFECRLSFSANENVELISHKKITNSNAQLHFFWQALPSKSPTYAGTMRVSWLSQWISCVYMGIFLEKPLIWFRDEIGFLSYFFFLLLVEWQAYTQCVENLFRKGFTSDSLLILWPAIHIFACYYYYYKEELFQLWLWPMLMPLTITSWPSCVKMTLIG